MICIIVANKSQRRQVEHPGGPIEFGRGPRRQVERIVVQDPYVSSDQLRVEEISDGRVRVENLSLRNPITLADGSTIEATGTRDLSLPARLTVGETLIELGLPTAGSFDRGSLQTVAMPVRVAGGSAMKESLAKLGSSPTAETVAGWFETLIHVQRAAAGSTAFYQQTARAIVDLVGLDRGLVLLRRNSNWQVVAHYSTAPDCDAAFSATVLGHVLDERRTFFQPPEAHRTPGSLLDIEAVVASPILDANDEVIGAVYGSRSRTTCSIGLGVQPLEAQVVQLLAATVGVGLARLEREAEAARSRIQFEQFFSPELARELERDSNLLEGRERVITVLFCDVRGFSRISERIGPRDTCRLVSEIMERLTARIRQQSGVVVDYIGDGLLAMWNAPVDQPGHAALACRAALAMMSELPALDHHWQDSLGGPLGLGIGINSGSALVGNTGSRLKFKYGPLGHTVNLASRIEGATKQLGVPILISGVTQSQIGDRFATRRLCRVRVVGIAEPVDLFELHDEITAAPSSDTPANRLQPGLADWLTRRDSYEAALALFEAGRWAEASRTILPLLPAQGDHYDVPTLTLASRALDIMKSPTEEFDPVLTLRNK